MTVTSLSGIPTYTDTFTWGVDGEDRPNSFKLGSTTIISATAGSGFQYDAASRPLNVAIGTAGDQDTYTYDNVGNMHTYTFAVNGKSDAGTLTWNANGSLGTLAISDTFNAGGSQTCNFSYDDVARLISDNCGTVWSQTYDYGVNGGEYENLTQSGSASWSPGYNANNNQMNGSTYDANGKVLYDGVNTFTWNFYGKMASARSGNNAAVCGSSGTCITYDANGRAVETVTGGTIRQLLYSPIGLTAQMNGQTPIFSHIFTPGGGAVHSTGSNGGGSRSYLHSDWLGSARLSTLIVNRTASYDTAYGPYGVAYDRFGTVNPVDFTGDPQNIFSGLFDTPNRELAQYAGRWPSPDPAHASWNAYSYPTDPNRQTDPTGLDGQSPCEGAGNCELANDHISPLMNRFFVPDSTKYGTDGRPAPWLRSNSEGAQNQSSGGFWQKLGNALSGNGWKTNADVANDQRQWLTGTHVEQVGADGKLSPIDWSKKSDAEVGASYNYMHQVMDAATANHLWSLVGVAATVTFGHGARHLAGTGLNQGDVESAIQRDVETGVKNSTQATGNFWGRVNVGGQTVEYRAYSLPNGTINVGTYYIP